MITTFCPKCHRPYDVSLGECPVCSRKAAAETKSGKAQKKISLVGKRSHPAPKPPKEHLSPETPKRHITPPKKTDPDATMILDHPLILDTPPAAPGACGTYAPSCRWEGRKKRQRREIPILALLLCIVILFLLVVGGAAVMRGLDGSTADTSAPTSSQAEPAQ